LRRPVRHSLDWLRVPELIEPRTMSRRAQFGGGDIAVFCRNGPTNWGSFGSLTNFLDAPQLDLSYVATSTASAGNVFLYASDTDFTTSGSFLLTVGGTNSGGSGTETTRAWGGTSDTEFQFSGANLLGTLAPSGPIYSGTVAGPFSSAVNPYSLTIGVTISRSTSGTSTGDLNLQVAAIPEPETYAILLAGLGLLGFVARRRKQKSA
jgi:hypothetical protein